MNRRLVEEVANAVLYEGYMLYPYRASAVKNRRRWNFGVVAPAGGGDASSMQTECLVQAEPQSSLDIRVRFLQLAERFETGQAPPAEPWQEAFEREVNLAVPLGACPLRESFAYPAGETIDGLVTRRWEALEGDIEVETKAVPARAFQVCVRIVNRSAREGRQREAALLRSLVSTHTILSVGAGEFVSSIDPPEQFRELAAQCRNTGTWPVLVGEAGQRDAMLSSPIILYDYPQIAAESPGALFDCTEIDEILTLRIMTLTDAEKDEMRQADQRTREILERTEALPAEHMMKLHGALRGLRSVAGEAP